MTQWFRRDHYRGSTSTDPLWHLLVDVTVSHEPRYLKVWTAACGYQQRIIATGTPPRVQSDRKSHRCKKCQRRFDMEES